MKKFVIIFVMFLSLAYQAFAAPDDPDSAKVTSPWSGGAEVAATNKYLWRGMTVNEGFLLQPYAWLTCQNFTFSLWGSFTADESAGDIKRHEVDALASYEFNLHNFVIEGSFLYYHYIDQPDAPNTGELAGTIGYPLGIVTLTAGVSVDVIEYPGAVYLEQKIEMEKEFNDLLTVYSALTLGSGLKKFNESYMFDENDNPVAKSTLNLISVEGRLIYTMANGIYLSPYVQLNKTMDSELDVPLKKHNSCLGVVVGKEF